MVKSINILALDTSGNACSVAVWVESRVCAARFEIMERGQAEALAPMVATVLEDAKLDLLRGLDDIHAVAVTRGPGTFTGIRIGMATAKALALPGKLPVIGLTTFDAIRCCVDQNGLPLLGVIETKRDDFYVQLFDKTGIEASQPAALGVEEILQMLPRGPLMAVGDGADRLNETLMGKGHEGLQIVEEAPANAEKFAPFAARQFQAGALAAPTPLYLKAPSVTLRRSI